MQTIRETSALRSALAKLRGAGEHLALVPTMGALHAGHLALVTEARQRAEQVMATIFVNPLQFAPGEDLDRYPRREAQDLAMLEEAGCALVWMPTVADLYPDGFATTIHVAGTSEQWEGAARPGHFDGVATVVAKLLIATMPDFALFGEKDYQQLAVIRRLVADLGLPTQIAGVPTVRDGDGLALSSRNAYLSPDERQRALALPRVLGSVRDAVRSGVPVRQALEAAMETLGHAGFGPIDYVALVDSATLEPLDALTGAARVIAAARIGTTRLIDNIAV